MKTNSENGIPIPKDNKHIEAYLDSYVEQRTPPGYAVLLTGPWGCGKSWFINDYLKKADKKHKSVIFSVAGCSSVNDISNKLAFSIMHLERGKKWLTHIKSVIGAVDGVDKNGILKLLAAGGSVLTDIYTDKQTDYFSLIVIDDLERSCVPSMELIGFINSFVEIKGIKVVLVANKEKLSPEFIELKEKIIGQTFMVHSESDAAIDLFIKDFKPQNINKDEITKCVQAVFSHTEHNLRALKQSFFDYNRLYEDQSELIKTTTDIEMCLFLEILLFRIGLNTGAIEDSDISNIISYGTSRYTFNMDLNADEKKEKEKNKKSYEKVDAFKNKIFQSIDPDSYYRGLMSVEFVFSFFCDGRIDADQFKNDVNASIFIKQELPEWYPFSRYLECQDDDELKNMYTTFWERIKNHEYMHPGDFLQVVGIFLSLSEKGYAHGHDKLEIIENAQRYIKNINWKISEINAVTERKPFTDWRGRGNLAKGSNELNSVYTDLECKKNALLSTLTKNKIHDLPNQVRNNPDEALDDFIAGSGKTYDINLVRVPVLVDLDVDDFVDATLSLLPNKQMNIFGDLSRRYNVNGNWVKNLVNETNMLQAVYNKIKAISEDPSSPEVLKLRIKMILKGSLKKALEKMENIKNKTPKE